MSAGNPNQKVYVYAAFSSLMKFDLRFEIADGKSLVNFLGKIILPAKQALEISERISEQISGKFSGNFFSNFVSFFSETSFSRRAVLRVCISMDVFDRCDRKSLRNSCLFRLFP